MAVGANGLFSLDADRCIQQAFSLVSHRQDSGYDVRIAREALQMILHILTLRRLNLWTVERQTKTPVLGAEVIEFDEQTVDLLEVTIQDLSQASPSQINLARIPRDQYTYLPNKTVLGRPIQFWFDRQRDIPRMFIYPRPEKGTYQIEAFTIRTLRDINSMTDSIDVPNRWTPILVHGLAWQLASREPKKDEVLIARLKQEFDALLDIALEEDRDSGPLRVGLDLSRYRV